MDVIKLSSAAAGDTGRLYGYDFSKNGATDPGKERAPESKVNTESAILAANLFSKIDGNNDEVLDQKGFEDLVSQLKLNTGGLVDYLQKASLSAQGNFTFSMTQQASISIEG